ncbi:flagellar hook-basal body complex protein FliE [bacterium]|nr:flagellar hook-basal body complex protein FliE [bacterium]
MQFSSINPNMMSLQTQFNPIQNYNNFLKGNASLQVNNDFQNDFDRMLQNEIKAEEEAAKRKFNNMSSVDGLMNSIENAFGNGLNDVNEQRMQLDAMQEAFARGEDVSIHDLMIASEKSALSMQMAMQIRNKLISAYTDLKNMSV